MNTLGDLQLSSVTAEWVVTYGGDTVVSLLRVDRLYGSTLGRSCPGTRTPQNIIFTKAQQSLTRGWELHSVSDVFGLYQMKNFRILPL